MYFYVDESGQTGLNLFDPQQPILYYGVLSSPHNVDEVANDEIQELRERFGVARLHSSELGMGRLTSIASELSALQAKLDLTIDIYRISKPDHALISFFDQLFDQGLNKAVPWSAYWTPLRFVVLAKLAYLFDEDLIKLARKARIEKKTEKANTILQEVCNTLLCRIDYLPDPRDAPINLSCSRGKLQFSRHLQRYWTKSDRKIMYGELFRPVLRVKREPHPYP
ncbi:MULTISPECIES: DUF3800 domain-containing protein [Pseudomonas]|uniref:DUF3800 domain-containing protein n=4 Tax=Pseudomonas TaxID=286 RepID=UPI00104F0FFA|nr:DUF3800 domain-containing protein [Pseudomonas monteilii]MBA6140749.1 DUF3800 domain-containing protein [Pseudomonas monteilii]